MVTLVLFSVFIIALIINIPIGVCMGLATLAVLLFVPDAPGGISLLVKSTVTGGDNFPLIAIPMFILVGEIMQTGGLSRRIIGSAAAVVGNVRAGLAYVNVLASMIFAAISGSSPATVAAIGSNMIPEMKKYGYDPTFSTALTAASGTLGVMIPPSIPFIIYGVTASESIGALFLAGIIPGLIFGLFYALLARFQLRNKVVSSVPLDENGHPEPVEEKKGGIRNSSWWALLVPIIILGGIYGGIFTPTEAAGVTVGYALLVSMAVYRELNWDDIPDILVRTSVTSVCCLIMVVMASPFGRLLTIEQVPNQVAAFITSLSDQLWVVVILINLFLLVVGMFMDTIAAIIILTPILAPVVVGLGMSPIQFGVILTCNLAVGFCTPPLGINLFVASNISGVPIAQVIKAIVPYIGVMLIALAMVSYIPAISLLLPELLN
jgi:C4-dicarboxylate transporter DctM subunit